MFYSSLSSMGMATNKGQAEYDLNEARAEADETKSEADLLKHDIDRLMMITESLWTFMKKEHGYSMTSWPRQSARLICGTVEPIKMRRRNAPPADGWFRSIAIFVFIAAIRFRKACLSLEPIATRATKPARYTILIHTVFKYAGSARLMGKSGGCGT